MAINGLFARVHASFQSILILAERGLVLDARTLLRSLIECAIAINALARDSAFLSRMIEANYRHTRAEARAHLERFADWSPEDIAQMQEEIARANAHEASLGRSLTDIRWDQVADRHCPHDYVYHFLYRNLSFDGVRATLGVLARFPVSDTGRVESFGPRPDGKGIASVLADASLMFLLAAGPYAEANRLNDFQRQVVGRIKEYHALNGCAR